LMIFAQKDKQALKIKSPLLLTVFMCANILTIVLLLIVYLNAEICTRGCSDGLMYVSGVSGYLLVSFAEPMCIISYLVRFLRIKKIFDAQQEYFEKGVRPTALIQQFSELRLIMYVVLGCSFFCLAYMATALGTWLTENGQYGLLPTYMLSVDDGNEHMYVSLIYFVVTTFVEGLAFAYFLDQILDIKREFSMLPELQMFTFAWLLTTDLTLFLIIQGVAVQLFTTITYYRIMFWLILVRQIAIVLITTVKPLYDSSKDTLFFPIPPNRECIESVDMVLHIPVAVDYFYNYLISRHEQLKDKQAIHLIALYIDLRLYDQACSDNRDAEDKREIAIDIFQQYLSEEAQKHRNSDIEAESAKNLL